LVSSNSSEAIPFSLSGNSDDLLSRIKEPIGTHYNRTTSFSLESQGQRGRDPMVVGFTTTCAISSYPEEFEDTKGTIRIRISKKNRQHNGQKKKYKRTNNDLQNIHIKLKIE
jgi:hypothetical protein